MYVNLYLWVPREKPIVFVKDLISHGDLRYWFTKGRNLSIVRLPMLVPLRKVKRIKSLIMYLESEIVLAYFMKISQPSKIDLLESRPR